MSRLLVLQFSSSLQLPKPLLTFSGWAPAPTLRDEHKVVHGAGSHAGTFILLCSQVESMEVMVFPLLFIQIFM